MQLDNYEAQLAARAAAAKAQLEALPPEERPVFGMQPKAEDLELTGKTASGGLRPKHPTINHILAKLP